MAGVSLILSSIAAKAAANAPTLLAATGAGTSVLGSLAEARATEQSALNAQAAADFQAEQLERRATEELAVGQQQAQEARLRKNLTLSRLQAQAAGSGFEATDPTTLQIATDIDVRGEQQAGLALHQGLLAQDDMLLRADTRRAEGAAAVAGARGTRTGTILGGVGNMARFASGLNFETPAPTGGQLRYG